MLNGSYSSLNKGDYAMSQAIIKEISKRMDDISFEIFTSNPKLDQEKYLQYFGSNIQIHFKKEYLRNPFNAIFLNLCAYAGYHKFFDDYDVIIDVSGDMIGESYSMQSTFYHILYLNLFKNLKKKIDRKSVV